MKKIMMSTLMSGTLLIGVGTTHAADIYLCAGAVNKTMSDGITVPMWGYAEVANAALQGVGCGVNATVPGPELSNAGGGPLNIYLYNDGLTEAVSVIIPGQNDTSMTPVMFTPAGDTRPRVRSFAPETASGTSTIYTWNSIKAGSFIYQSGTHIAVQVQMGLYGAFVQDTALKQAYGATTTYDTQLNVFYSEVDPVLHTAISNGTYGTTITSTIDYAPRYFLLNGLDVATPSNRLLAGNAAQTTLLRFFNMGYQSHVPNIQGLYMNVIAEDGHAFTYPKQQYSALLAAGQTVDALVTPTITGDYAFYDRVLNLTNKNVAGIGVLRVASQQTPGSMISFLAVAPAAVDSDGDGVLDSTDNCTLVSNPRQIDSNGDGFGNMCDADLNNDGAVNLADYSIFRTKMGSTDADADLNSDAIVNLSDYSLFRQMFGSAPGPSAVIVAPVAL